MSKIENEMRHIVVNSAAVLGPKSDLTSLKAAELWCSLKAVTYLEAILRSSNVDTSSFENFQGELQDINNWLVPESFTVAISTLSPPYGIADTKIDYAISEDSELYFTFIANVLEFGFIVTNLDGAFRFINEHNSIHPTLMMLGANRNWPIFHDGLAPISWHELEIAVFHLLGRPEHFRWITKAD